jgi:hypothetical protein
MVKSPACGELAVAGAGGWLAVVLAAGSAAFARTQGRRTQPKASKVSDKSFRNPGMSIGLPSINRVVGFGLGKPVVSVEMTCRNKYSMLQKFATSLLIPEFEPDFHVFHSQQANV